MAHVRARLLDALLQHGDATTQQHGHLAGLPGHGAEEVRLSSVASVVLGAAALVGSTASPAAAVGSCTKTQPGASGRHAQRVHRHLTKPAPTIPIRGRTRLPFEDDGRLALILSKAPRPAPGAVGRRPSRPGIV
ncbi:hypothetical protein [Nonomuraea turcica]|uniref:hypothetical protein n=1 Tax=Nonomuraea sp. G32 TaxID=3067274 RepID=UPI00273C8956|nr:hypothetical protein [Nonomuraea sp. G32]MDP4500781.1 hypothetical protein [Nonomuraea sp. G32]